MPIKEQFLRFNDSGVNVSVLLPVSRILMVTLVVETPGSEQIEVHFEQETGSGSNTRPISVVLDVASSQQFLQDARDLTFGNYTGAFNL